MGRPPSYSKLEQDDINTEFETATPTLRSSPRSRILYLVKTFIIFLFALVGLISIVSATATTLIPSLTGYFHPYLKWGWVHRPHRRSCSCGRTLDEAVAKGCRYDSHALAWLPPHCQDFELLAEWERSGDGANGQWQYWADRNATIPLSVDEVGDLAARPMNDRYFWMTQEWHVKHCAFSWRKLARSPVTGVTIDRGISGIPHIEHCEKTFLARTNLSMVLTRAQVVTDADFYETMHMFEDDYWEIPN